MLKRILIIFLFFVANLTFAQTFTASQKIPDKVTSGSSFLVATTVNKGPSVNIMIYSQSIPKGFSATEIDCKGGDFKFEKNEVKIIWIAPPAEKVFTFRYQINVPSDSSGERIFNSKISYTVSNTKGDIFVFPSKKIILNDEGQQTIGQIKENQQTPVVTKSNQQTLAQIKETQQAKDNQQTAAQTKENQQAPVVTKYNQQTSPQIKESQQTPTPVYNQAPIQTKENQQAPAQIKENQQTQVQTKAQKDSVETLKNSARKKAVDTKNLTDIEGRKLGNGDEKKLIDSDNGRLSDIENRRFIDSLKLIAYEAETRSLRARLNMLPEKTNVDAAVLASDKEWSSIAASLAETAALHSKLNMEPEKTEILTRETGFFSDSITKSGTRAENNAALELLKTKLETGQNVIRKLKEELDNTTVSQINVLNAINAKNTSSAIRTDTLLSQLNLQSDFNETEINRLKAELEKAKIVAANTLRIINLRNSAANAEASSILSQLKTKSDSGQVEINKLRAELGKIKVSESNTSNAISSTDGSVRTSQTDYFIDEFGKPVGSGFYIILGTFGYKENADKYRASIRLITHLNTKIIQNQFTKVYNIYCTKATSRAQADAERMKYKSEYQDVWILKLE